MIILSLFNIHIKGNLLLFLYNDTAEKLLLKEKLASDFETKDLEKMKYFLRIEVAYSKQGIFIFTKSLGSPEINMFVCVKIGHWCMCDPTQGGVLK